MCKFPAWVEGPRTKKPDMDALATRRLRYLVITASINTNESGSIASFSDFCGVERTQVHAALREGRFSAKMATKIEKACGRSVVRREWLTYPLDIEEMST